MLIVSLDFSRCPQGGREALDAVSLRRTHLQIVGFMAVLYTPQLAIK